MPLDAPFFPNAPLLKTKSFFEMERFVVSTLCAKIIEFPKKEDDINLVASRHTLKNSEMWFCSYGCHLTLQFPDSDYIRVQVHSKGHGSTVLGKEELAVTPQQCVVSAASAQIKFSPDFEQTVLRINRSYLEQKIADLTGIPPIRPLEFAAVFNPSAPEARVFRQTFNFLMRMLDSTQNKIPSLVLAEMEETLILAFLSCCPNKYSDVLEYPPAKPSHWQVRRVEEYLEAHWNKPLKIQDIVAISGSSARSLFRGFQQSRGYSPYAFLKQVRLQQARKMLLNTENTKPAKVTEIAFTCGFGDLGRFSKEYKKAFGELPSQTLKQQKSKERFR